MVKKYIEKYQFTSDQSREKAAQNGRKGGIASGEAKRRNKTMKEIALMLLNTKVPNNKYTEEMLNLFPDMDAQDLQYQTAILVSQIQKAVFDKDSKAAEYVRDTSGQKPVEQTVVAFDDNNELIIDLGEEEDIEENGTEDTEND